MANQTKSLVYKNLQRLSKLTGSKNRTPWVGFSLTQMIPEQTRLLALQTEQSRTDNPYTIAKRNLKTLNQKELWKLYVATIPTRERKFKKPVGVFRIDLEDAIKKYEKKNQKIRTSRINIIKDIKKQAEKKPIGLKVTLMLFRNIKQDEEVDYEKTQKMWKRCVKEKEEEDDEWEKWIYVTTKIFLIKSTLNTIFNDIESLIKRYYKALGGRDYNKIKLQKYTIHTNVPQHTFLTVPLKRTEAPELQLFNEQGEFIINNQNEHDGLCMPRFIQKKVFPKKSIDTITEEINKVVNDFDGFLQTPYDCIQEGVSLNQFEWYCKKYRMSFRAMDCFGNMFYKYVNPNWNKNLAVCMFIVHDGHIYDITDKSTRQRLQTTGNQSTQLHKNIKDSRKEKAIKKPKNKFMEYSEDNLERLIKSCDPVDDIDLYTTNSSIVSNYFFSNYAKGKWLRHKSKGQEMIYVYYKKNAKLIWNEDWVSVSTLCAIQNKDFNNQSIASIAIELLSNDLNCVKSHFNDISNDYVKMIPNSALCRSYNKIDQNKNVVSIDINKMYTSIIRDTKYYLKTSSLYEPTVYDGEDIKDDYLYTIDIKPQWDDILITESGVYYPELVRQALQDKIINKNNITSQLQCIKIETDVLSNFSKAVCESCSTYSKEVINYFDGGSDINNFFIKYTGIGENALKDKLVSKSGVGEFKLETTISKFTNYINKYCLAFSKQIINYLIGSFGRKTTQTGDVYYTNDLNTAVSDFFIKEDTRFVCEVYREEGVSIFSTDNLKEVNNNRNLFLIRNQIVQTGNLLTYQLRKQMKGKLIKISTDCVSVEYEDGLIRPIIHLSDAIGGFKIEDKLPKRMNDKNLTNERNKFQLKPLEPIVEIKIKDERDNQELLGAVKGKSVFITGNGGTGKSYLGKFIKENYESENKKVLSIAPTHIATKALDAITCHKGLGFGINGKTHNSNYTNVDVIYIDEISMLSSTFYNELCEIKINNPHIIFIATGDFNQLPPVGEDEINFQESRAFKFLFPFIIELKENKRNTVDGEELFDITTRLLNGEDVMDRFNWVDNFDSFDLHLTFTNKKRKEINKILMDKYSMIADQFLMCGVPERKEEEPDEEPDDAGLDYSQEIILYKGLPLRARVTKEINSHLIKNGDQYTVLNFTENIVTLQKDDSKFANYKESDEKVLVYIPIDKNFTHNFNPNYAMTVHNSQCQSFNVPYVIHESHKYTIRMMNTAIGRTRKIEFVNFA